MSLNLAAYYEHMTYVHALTGLLGKLAFAVSLALVAAGNRNPGERLFVGMIGTALLLGGWLAWSTSGENSYAAFRTGMRIVSVIGFVAGIAVLISVIKHEGQLNLRPPTAWRKWIGWAFIVWGLYYPVFNDSWVRAIFFSPISVLPQPIMLIGGAVAFLSYPNANRLFAWTMIAGLFVISLLDLLTGVQSSIVPLLLALLLVAEMLRSTIKAGGITADDKPPVDREKAQRIRLKSKEKQDPQRTWKLK